MQKIKFGFLFFFISAGVALFSLLGCNNSLSENIPVVRVKTLFDNDWKFQLSDTIAAKDVNFDDSDWTVLDLPHDWSIEGDYNQSNPAGIQGAFLPTGIAWYRKQFNWNNDWTGKRIAVQFDGVYCNSTVYINGKELGTRPNGYISFEYELTDFLKKGENVIAVRVDHEKAPTGRWYTGSGIYRHVHLEVTDKLYVKTDGVFITSTDVSEEKAKLNVDLELVNKSEYKDKVDIKLTVLDQNSVVKESMLQTHIETGLTELCKSILLPNPKLWSPKNPNLYKLKVEIAYQNELLDNYEVKFGVRTIDITAEKGLLINGEKTILKGVCMHHDAGPVGAAVPDELLQYRLKLLKKMGCNAIRTTHNPFAPEFYKMTDSLGFLVMNEAFDGWETEKAPYDYGLYFEKWWKTDLEAFVKRDRNHPSVILWSVGNEVRGFTQETQAKLVSFVKALDPSRMITQGRGYRGVASDISGFNGHGEVKGVLEEYHEKNPLKPVVGTEITHNYQTRGVYRTKTWYRRRDFPAPWEKGKPFSTIEKDIFKIQDLSENEVFKDVNPIYQSSYDNSIVRMGIIDYWKETKDKSYFLGAFRWTGFDYLGESFGWPARTMNFGVIDLANFPTDNYYLYQSLWSDKPMVHLLPHWTHSGKEGVVIPVVVYTNCKEAELFLNGKSLGKKKMDDDYKLVWDVPYAKGELKVEAITNSGDKITKAFESAGVPFEISVKTNKSTVSKNYKDVVVVELSIVDKKGIEVPHANSLLEFKIQGPGKIIGVENGDVLDLSNSKLHKRKAFNGKCMLLVQPTEKSGDIILTIESVKLKSKSIHININ